MMIRILFIFNFPRFPRVHPDAMRRHTYYIHTWARRAKKECTCTPTDTCVGLTIGKAARARAKFDYVTVLLRRRRCLIFPSMSGAIKTCLIRTPRGFFEKIDMMIRKHPREKTYTKKMR
jgi:hypothetical protein